MVWEVKAKCPPGSGGRGDLAAGAQLWGRYSGQGCPVTPQTPAGHLLGLHRAPLSLQAGGTYMSHPPEDMAQRGTALTIHLRETGPGEFLREGTSFGEKERPVPKSNFKEGP